MTHRHTYDAHLRAAPVQAFGGPHEARSAVCGDARMRPPHRFQEPCALAQRRACRARRRRHIYLYTAPAGRGRVPQCARVLVYEGGAKQVPFDLARPRLHISDSRSRQLIMQLISGRRGRRRLTGGPRVTRVISRTEARLHAQRVSCGSLVGRCPEAQEASKGLEIEKGELPPLLHSGSRTPDTDTSGCYTFRLV